MSPGLLLAATPWAIKRVALAWLALLVSGLSNAITGELTWHIAGREIYGERVVFAMALLAAGEAVWGLGQRSRKEDLYLIWTLLAGLLAVATSPFGRELHQPMVWLLHVGLTLQLVAWWHAASSEKTGVGILALGLSTEAFLIFPLAQLSSISADCANDPMIAMRLTCVADSAWVAMALPAAISLALILWWLDPLARAPAGGSR